MLHIPVLLDTTDRLGTAWVREDAQTGFCRWRLAVTAPPTIQILDEFRDGGNGFPRGWVLYASSVRYGVEQVAQRSLDGQGAHQVGLMCKARSERALEAAQDRR